MGKVTLMGIDRTIPDDWQCEIDGEWEMGGVLLSMFWEAYSPIPLGWSNTMAVNLTMASLLTSAEELAWLTHWKRLQQQRRLRSDNVRY